MQRPAFLSRLSRVPAWGLRLVLGLVVLLVALRVALPYIVERYVNRQLDSLPGYAGSIEDVDIHLLRGAYRIEEIKIDAVHEQIPVPVLRARAVDLSVQWNQLFQGALVGEMIVDRPQINYVADGSRRERPGTPADTGDWRRTVKSLFPLKLNRFSVRDGSLHFRDFSKSPKVDIYLDEIGVEATNLTNSLDVARSLAAHVEARARAMKKGRVRLDLDLDPFQTVPTFNMDLVAEKIDLPQFNDFFRRYVGIDLQSGTLGLYAEFAASKGEFQGYIKPLIVDLNILGGDKEKDESLAKKAKEVIAEGVSEILESKDEKEQVATRIPMSGKFENPEAGVWPAVRYLFLNAFIRALSPRLERTIDLDRIAGGG